MIEVKVRIGPTVVQMLGGVEVITGEMGLKVWPDVRRMFLMLTVAQATRLRDEMKDRAGDAWDLEPNERAAARRFSKRLDEAIERISPTPLPPFEVICSQCGGSRVEHVAWIRSNTSVYVEDFGTFNEGDTTWCDDCCEHTRLIDSHSDPEEYRKVKARTEGAS